MSTDSIVAMNTKNVKREREKDNRETKVNQTSKKNQKIPTSVSRTRTQGPQTPGEDAQSESTVQVPAHSRCASVLFPGGVHV